MIGIVPNLSAIPPLSSGFKKWANLIGIVTNVSTIPPMLVVSRNGQIYRKCPKIVCKVYVPYIIVALGLGPQKYRNFTLVLYQLPKTKQEAGPWLAEVYRCYSTCGFLKASSERFEI